MAKQIWIFVAKSKVAEWRVFGQTLNKLAFLKKNVFKWEIQTTWPKIGVCCSGRNCLSDGIALKTDTAEDVFIFDFEVGNI